MPKNNNDTLSNKAAWTVAEFAERYGVCRQTVYHWFERGWLPSRKIGGARRILREDEDVFKTRFAA